MPRDEGLLADWCEATETVRYTDYASSADKFAEHVRCRRVVSRSSAASCTVAQYVLDALDECGVLTPKLEEAKACATRMLASQAAAEPPTLTKAAQRRQRRAESERKKQAQTPENSNGNYPEWFALHNGLCSSVSATVLPWLLACAGEHQTQDGDACGCSRCSETEAPPAKRAKTVPPSLDSPPPVANRLVRNDTQQDVVFTCTGSRYVLPPRSAFVLSDSGKWGGLVPPTASTFVLDPPWPSRSVRRSGAYGTSPLAGIADTLGFLNTAEEGCRPRRLFAVWATNSVGVISFVLEVLFRNWGVRHVASVMWLKADTQAVRHPACPIFPLFGKHRRPYELCFIADSAGEEPLAGDTSESPGDLLDTVLQHPLKVICAPVLEHSRKPCLDDCLKALRRALGFPKHDGFPTPDVAVELYARAVRTGWVCAGNEVLHYNGRGEHVFPCACTTATQ